MKTLSASDAKNITDMVNLNKLADVFEVIQEAALKGQDICKIDNRLLFPNEIKTLEDLGYKVSRIVRYNEMIGTKEAFYGIEWR